MNHLKPFESINMKVKEAYLAMESCCGELGPSPRVRGMALDAVGALANGNSLDREGDAAPEPVEGGAPADCWTPLGVAWLADTGDADSEDASAEAEALPPCTCVTGLPGIVSSHSSEFSCFNYFVLKKCVTPGANQSGCLLPGNECRGLVRRSELHSW